MTELIAHLTMTHGLFPDGVLPNVWVSYLGAAWSLSTEWQFYVLALALGRSRVGAERLAGTFLILAVAGTAWDLLAPDDWRFSRAFLPNKAQYFALGIASASWIDRRSIRSFVLVLAATMILSVAHGQAGKLLPPLFWTLCLAAQLYPSRWRCRCVGARFNAWARCPIRSIWRTNRSIRLSASSWHAMRMATRCCSRHYGCRRRRCCLSARLCCYTVM
jgi:peptidoglycan/LPS O-acetylase OafA/YrhL